MFSLLLLLSSSVVMAASDSAHLEIAYKLTLISSESEIVAESVKTYDYPTAIPDREEVFNAFLHKSVQESFTMFQRELNALDRSSAEQLQCEASITLTFNLGFASVSATAKVSGPCDEFERLSDEALAKAMDSLKKQIRRAKKEFSDF